MYLVNLSMQICTTVFSTAFKLSLLLIGALVSMSAYAEDSNITRYQIEYILISHLDQDLSELKYEPKPRLTSSKQSMNYVDTVLPEGQTPITGQLIFSIPSSQKVLSNAYDNLVRDGSVKVLQYRSWVQEFGEDDDLVSLAISERLSDSSLLEGEVTIRRSRYLHIEPNVILAEVAAVPQVNWLDWVLKQTSPLGMKELLTPAREPLPSPYANSPLHSSVINIGLTSDPEGEPTIDTRPTETRQAAEQLSDQLPDQLDQEVTETDARGWLKLDAIKFSSSRRVKDKEIHYLDHPAISLIATIQRLESNADDAELEPAI